MTTKSSYAGWYSWIRLPQVPANTATVTFGVTRGQCAGDGAKPDGSSAGGFGTRVVLTAFGFIRARGTGIAMAAASGSSSSGAAW